MVVHRLIAVVLWAGQVSVLKKAHHPNICQFLGCAIDPPTYCVVLEFMQGGSLFEAMRKKQVRRCSPSRVSLHPLTGLIGYFPILTFLVRLSV
jgi:serine/threonine protein kinase